MTTCTVTGCALTMKARGLCHHHYRLWYLAKAAPCQADDCSKPAWSRGLCTLHYRRLRKYGDVTVNLQAVEVPVYAAMHDRLSKIKVGECSTPGCSNATRTEMALIHGRGTHTVTSGPRAGLVYSTSPEDYRELCVKCHRGYDAPPKRTCSVVDCTNPHLARSYCRLHYKRWKATGDPLKVRERWPK